MKNTNRLAVSFMLGALLAYSFSACATLPAATPAERVAHDAAACLKNGPCFVLQVDNGGYYEGTVRVNGSIVGRVLGNHASTIFVRESQLIDGRCAQVSIYFRDISQGVSTSRECIRPGGRFRLAVDPMYHAWLISQGGGGKR